MIKNVFKAVLSVIAEPELRKVVSKKEEKRRRAICANCPKYSPTTTQCDVCGCIMWIKAKLLNDPVESAKQGKMVKTDCPLEKWDIENNKMI